MEAQPITCAVCLIPREPGCFYPTGNGTLRRKCKVCARKEQVIRSRKNRAEWKVAK